MVAIPERDAGACSHAYVPPTGSPRASWQRRARQKALRAE